MLDLLRQMDAATLDEAIRSGLSPGRRELEYLVGERVHDLSVPARAALIGSLQRGFTTARKEKAIRALLLATHGADLTRLKRLIDRGPDHRDLAHLLYHDIDLGWLRQDILDHFQREASAHPCGEVKVLSDVDDTFYRNWVDPRFPPRTVYPGVVQLYRELEGREIGDIVFLTGRPGERSGKLKRTFRRRLGALGAPEAGMLTGSFVHQFVHPWVFARKWRNFERYRQLFPEMGIIMFGDSGQADPEFIGQALERFPGHVRAGLIHRVKPLDPQRHERCQQQGVFFFDTYVGAALYLHQRALLSREGLERVCSAAQENLEGIKFPDEAMARARQSELAADLARARQGEASFPTRS